MQPELVAVVARRTARLDAVSAASRGLVTGALVTACLAFTRMPSAVVIGIGVAMAAFVSAASWIRTTGRRGNRAAAMAIERVHPAANVVITAEELQRHPERAAQWIIRRIAQEAAAAIEGLRPAEIVPAGRAALTACIAVIAVVAATLAVTREATIRELVKSVARSIEDMTPGAPGIRVTVTIEPPAYSGRSTATVENPARLEALEGSRVRFGLPREGKWSVRFGQTAVPGTFIAKDDGYFAIADDSRREATRLIPLAVIRDGAPVVKIEAPAKDLLLPDGARTIPVTIVASDDLALRSVELRYTKVSGTGEQFEFQEGSIPLEVNRTSEREWRGGARLPLQQLRLGAGDSLVYRAVANDRRPADAGLGTSDTYLVEIAGPGQVALEGIDMPPDMERYALSQQMIVQKIERLRAREHAIAREALAEESATIAAEQRAVRANFVFLMGGHVEDEEVEAEQSHEIQEGRLENTARREINRAIGYMTRTEQALVGLDTAAALPPAKQAVEALQRAFGRSRYILRSLAVRSRLDPSRRLTGELEDALSWRRAGGQPGRRAGEDAREFLVRLIGLASSSRIDATALSGLAERALVIDPASSLWQEVSRQLLAAARTGSSQDIRRVLADVITRVGPEANRDLLPRTGAARPQTPLSRAWQAERQR